MKNNRAMTARSGFSKGFTMLELLIVMGIMATLIGIAIPSYIDWRRDIVYRKTSRDIVYMLREAKSRSIATNRQHRVQFDPTNRMYRLDMGNQAMNSANWTTVLAYVRLSDDVTMLPSTPTIDFSPNGTANLLVPATVRIQTRTGALRFTIQVENTGRIFVQ